MSQNLFSPSSGSIPVRWIRTSGKSPCPVCGKAGYCEVSDNSRSVHCMRVPSSVPMRYRQGGWLHQLAPVDKEVTSADLKVSLSNKAEVKVNPLSAALVDNLNRTLLALCPLSEAHQRYLCGVGVDPAGCGSLSYARASSVARQLVRQYGETTASRHPALLKVERGNGRNYWTLAGAANGILFPATNLKGEILGIQIRKDQPRGQEDRYRWLSHNGLGGTPLTVFRAAPEAARAPMVIITEGYKKAALAAKTWGCHAISLAGVSAYKEADLIQTLEELRASVVTIAFDQDKRRNAQVRSAEQRLLKLLAATLPERSFYFLNWPEAVGKGLDDALTGGAEFCFEQALDADNFEGPRLINNLPDFVVEQTFSHNGPLYTLEGARAQHRQFFDRLLFHPNPGKTQHVITSPTGTGKSRAADDALADALLAGKLIGRWLILAPNRANIVERIEPGTQLGKAVRSGLAAIQRGRTLFDLQDLAGGGRKMTPEDCANPQATVAGAARQITARVVCANCPFGSDQNWLDHATEVGFDPKQSPQRPWKCETQGYLNSRKVSRQAQVVIATKEAYLNNLGLLADFDGGVIVDEELLGYLVEIITLDSVSLSGWREKIAVKNLSFPAWEQLFKIIESTFNNLAESHLQPATAQLLESRQHLEAAATSLGLDLDQVLHNCRHDGQGPDQDGNYSFEQAYRHNAKLVFPFRGGADLLEALEDKENPPRFSRQANGSYAIVAHRPRRHLIEQLRDKTLVVLDATMPPVLKMLLPDLKELHYRVRQNLHITQITNALYTKRDLFKPATRQRVEAAIKAFAAGSHNHLSVVPLRFQRGPTALQLPAESRTEHWGLHRATSRFSDCDSLVLVGHHLRPIDYIRAEVIACRAYSGTGTNRAVEREASGPAHPLKLRLYNHKLTNGRAVARWMMTTTDTDVQAAIEHDYSANIIQAIGRLRAAIRPDYLPQARVLILCNEPVADLKIDILTTVDELITNPPQRQLFINNSYMKTGKEGVLLPAYTAVGESRDLWSEDLTLDETRETQSFSEDEWPDQTLPPLLE